MPRMSSLRETRIERLVVLGEAMPVFDLNTRLNEAPVGLAARLRSAREVPLQAQFDWANEWQARGGCDPPPISSLPVHRQSKWRRRLQPTSTDGREAVFDGQQCGETDTNQ